MNILLLGSGGREHALGWKIAQSSRIDRLYIAPGNAGTTSIGTNVNIAVDDFDAIKNFVLENNIELVVVGPEAPLVAGISDFFSADEELANIPVIGPNREGAQLEGSKDFAKQFMAKHGIPTAAYQSFTKNTLAEGMAFLETLKAPYVLKADGLAAGKGVVIVDDLEEAKAELTEMLSESKFGKASETVVVEEFLDGIELSMFAITDGEAFKLLPEAKDYKRIGDGDVGLNTGGMGAVSPVPFVDKEFMRRVEYRIIKPTIEGLRAEGIDYKGFIFFGLMNVDGDPYVIEYNVRLGDPETEVIIPRLKSDILELFEGVITNTLSERHVEIDDRTASTVMLVSEGYPGSYEKGKSIVINGEFDNGMIFHAGTKHNGNEVVTNGGRVIAVTSYGRDIEEAVERSYKNVERVFFKGRNFRKDIGQDLFKPAPVTA